VIPVAGIWAHVAGQFRVLIVIGCRSSRRMMSAFRFFCGNPMAARGALADEGSRDRLAPPHWLKAAESCQAAGVLFSGVRRAIWGDG
jgi:hypothetical protein